MLILDARALRQALSMRATIDAVREGFIALSEDRVSMPIRSAITLGQGVALHMPAHIHGAPYTVTKIVSVQPKNASHSLPVIIGTILVVCAQTGQRKALLDGSEITAMRTGAASGLATDLLARQDASTLTVFGTGAQARTQIEAVATVRKLREITIIGRDSAKAARFAKEIRDLGSAEIKVSDKPREACPPADIVVTATDATAPLFTDSDIRPGTHVNAIGSFKPTMQELPPELVSSSRVYVDHRESAWEEAGDLIIPKEKGLMNESDVVGELGEVAIGRCPSRRSDDERTVFKSVGVAVQDAAVAARACELAMEKGLGQEVAL